MTITPSPSESIRFGWKATKQNFWYFAAIVGLYIVIDIILNALTDKPALFITLLADIINIFLTLGIIKISLSFLEGKKLPIVALFQQGRYFIKYVLASFILGLIGTLVLLPAIIIMIGIVVSTSLSSVLPAQDWANFWNAGSFFAFLIGLAGILAALYFSVKYQFYGYLIVDEGYGPLQALRESGKLTKGRWWSVFIMNLKLIGIFILGLLALLIGIFWAAPTSLIALAHYYRQLRHATHTS